MLRGASGAGKSDLALRMIMGPILTGPDGQQRPRAQLVADDQVLLSLDGPHLTASPPEQIAGLIEVRGVGIIRHAFAAPIALALIVDLVAREDVPRMSRSPLARCSIAGTAIPLSQLAPFEPSAPLKLHMLLEAALEA